MSHWCLVSRQKSLYLHQRDHSGYGLGQWEKALHSNASSHWLSPYTHYDPRITVIWSDGRSHLANNVIMALFLRKQHVLIWSQRVKITSIEYGSTQYLSSLNSLVPGRCGCDLKLMISKPISRIDILSTCLEIALTWMPHDLMDD